MFITKVKSFSFCFFLFIVLNFLCFPVYALEVNDVQTGEETGPSTQYDIIVDFPTDPIAVYEVPNPYAVEVMAMLGDVYQGTISDSILDYLIGFIDVSDDYLIYRSGQYTYVVITGNDFNKSGSTISGNGVVTTLTTSGGYNDTTYTLNQANTSFRVNISNSAYVYSNLDGCSDIIMGVRYNALTCHAVFMLFIFNVVRDLFRSIFN